MEEGANFENLVSSSSGSSTFVMYQHDRICGRDSLDPIRGISSASKPNSKAACCIISRKSDLAFSVPYASSLRAVTDSQQDRHVSEYNGSGCHS